ncbi:MAG: amidase, partial [Acetobacteraceae bacterium]
MPLGTIKLPTVAQLREVAEDLGLTMSDSELAIHRDCLTGSVAAYNLIDQMPDELPPVTYPRTPGRRPMAEENPLGAWYV